MDKSSNAPLLVDGQKVTAEKEFTPDKPTGTIDIPFTFKGISLAGKSIVVFENLYHEGVEVAVHADINDSNQTVEIAKPDEPSIKTKAAVNGEQKAHAVGEIAIIDTVSYVNLTPGKTYKLSGILMDKETGKPLEINGKQITAEKEFTPDKAVGTIDISFTFDASALKGKTIVVFEELFHEGKNVASHADIDDTDQTITFDTPEIKTKATVDGEKETDPLEKITLIDTVTYSNLTPGKTYTAKGVLMDKSTGKKLLIDGKEITAETEFRPAKVDGTVDLPFTFDASGLAGKSVVAFETLNHENIEIAVHVDIDDDDQTVVIRQPKLKTTATVGGKKEATISKELVLEDKVTYSGLTPGKEYTVKGVLMDKSTGKKFLVDGKEITAEAAFTPEKSKGEVTVTFKFNGSKVTAKTDLVVFEMLYRDGKEFAAHADINDEGQTVTLTPEKPKAPDVPKTGDDRNITLGQFAGYAPRRFDVTLQLSLDGPKEITDSTRGAGVTEKCLENFERLLSRAGEIPQNVSVFLGFKPTLSVDSMYRLDTKEKIAKYYQFFEGLIQKVVDLNLPNLSVNHPVPNIGVPAPAGKKDGEFFSRLVKNCRELERENGEKGYFRFYREITPFATNVRPKAEDTYNYPCFNCGTGSTNVGFLPNRLISSCHNGFVDVLEDYEKNFLENPDSSIDPKLFQPTHNKFTHTEADYPAYERQISHYNAAGSMCRMGCLAGFLRTLALAGEIDEKYATEEGAFRGAELYQSCTCNCLRDNYMVTGSTTLQPEGMIKLLLNGAIDYIMEEKENVCP